MFKFITNNLAAKIICLFLALSLWFYVAIGESKVDFLPGKIPLEFKNVPQDLVAISDIDSVQVKISADRSLWNKITSENTTAYIDLGGYSQGTYEVDVQVKTNISGIEIIEIVPSTILVRIEPVASKKVPVKIQTEGDAGENMVPGDATIEPEEVEVKGAKSVIDKITEAVALVKLNGETEQFEKVVSLIALDAQNEKIKGLNFNPSDVKVTLPIVAAGTTKTVGIKVNINGSPKEGYWISQITTTPSEIVISGNAGVLKGLNYLETNSIDVENIDKNTTRTVDLNIPSGISIVDNIKQIKVEIKLSSVETQKEVNTGFNYLNLASNLKVDSIDPSNLTIIIGGPADIINNLNSSNIKINLDLSGYKNAGNYSIDISKNMISVPEGVNIVGYVPSSVRVNIQNK